MFVAQKNRDAWSALRGYVYQVDVTILRWINLEEHQVLELERGEDIDFIQEDSESNEIIRQLEQIKYRNIAISLGQDTVLEMLFNFFQHKLNNTSHELLFRFVSNASYTKEKFQVGSDKKSVIEVWMDLYSSKNIALDDGRLFLIQQILIDRVARRLNKEFIKSNNDKTEKWRKFLDFIKDAGSLAEFIQHFEWSLDGEDHISIIDKIYIAIIDKGLATDKVEAEIIYSRLFMFVFKLLTVSDIKRVDREMLYEEIEKKKLDKSDRLLYDFLTKTTLALDKRLESIEKKSNHLIQKETVQERKRSEIFLSQEKRYKRRLREKVNSDSNLTIQVNLAYTKEGTEDEYVRRYFISPYPSDESQGFKKLFLDYLAYTTDKILMQNILILGSPGAGKTVLLLQFALALIEKANKDTNHPLPVILNLVTWKEEYETFYDWLEINLASAVGEYHISKKYAKDLASEGNLILLLDGFDEVKKEFRTSCLKKIWDYLRKKEDSHEHAKTYPQLIICSRTKEYINIDINAPVNASLLIKDLQPEYIRELLKELASFNSSAKALIDKINVNPEIATKINTAFDLYIALKLAPIHDYVDYEQEKLLRVYTQKELEKINGYNYHALRRYLSSIAIELDRESLVSFELVDVQPEWILSPSRGGKRQRFSTVGSYRFFLELFRTNLLCVILFISIFPFFAIGTNETLTNKFGIAAVLSILPGLTAGILMAILNRKDVGNIVTTEIKKISFKDFKFSRFTQIFVISFKKPFYFTSIAFIVGGIIVGLAENSQELSKHAILQSLNLAINNINNGYSILNESQAFSILILLLFFTAYAWNIERKKIIAKQVKYKIIRIVFNFPLQFSFAIAILGVLLGIGYGFYLGPYHVFFHNFYLGSFLGLVFAIILGIISGCFNGLLNTLFIENRTPKIKSSYQRFLSTLIFDFLKLSLPLTTILISVLFLSNPDADRAGVIAFFLVCQLISIVICLYNSPLIKHLTVRFLLFVQGKIPLRFSTFLDKIALTGLMEKDGGQWRFRHQLIQDLFYLELDDIYTTKGQDKDYSSIVFYLLKLIGLSILIYCTVRIFNNQIWFEGTILMYPQKLRDFYLTLKIGHVVKCLIFLAIPLDYFKSQKWITYFVLCCIIEVVIYGKLCGFTPFLEFAFSSICISIPSILVIYIYNKLVN